MFTQTTGTLYANELGFTCAVPNGRHFNESHTPAVDGLSRCHVDIDGRV